MKTISIFELERHLVPFYEWINHREHLPSNIWNMLENQFTAIENYGPGCVGPMGLGLDKELGYFILGSGQGPFVIWMEKPVPVSGPYPYSGIPIEYGEVKLDKLYLKEQEAQQIAEQTDDF